MEAEGLRWFNKQKLALTTPVGNTGRSFMDSEGVIRPIPGWVMIARDAAWGKNAEKEYAHAPWGLLLKCAREGDLKNWYQMILPGDECPARLYIDLDGDYDEPGKREGRSMETLQQCWPILMAHLQAHADRLGLNVFLDPIVLDSSSKGPTAKDGKFSHHIVIRAIDRQTGKECFFRNNFHVGAFLRTALVTHKGAFPEWIRSMVDSGVYTTYRVFRFIFAAKLKAGAVKLGLFHPARKEGETRTEGERSIEYFRHTVPQPPFLPEDFRVIECEDLASLGGKAVTSGKAYEKLELEEEEFRARNESSGGLLPFAGTPPPLDDNYLSTYAREYQGSGDDLKYLAKWKKPDQAILPRQTIYRLNGPAHPSPLDGFTTRPNMALILAQMETVQMRLPPSEISCVLPSEICLYDLAYSFKVMRESQRHAMCLIAKAKARIVKHEEFGGLGKLAISYVGHDITTFGFKTLGSICSDYVMDLTGNMTTQELRLEPPDGARAPHTLMIKSRSRLCAIAQREHKSNTVFFEFHLNDATVVQKCTDAVCAGCVPVKMAVPGKVAAALFLAKEWLRALEFA